MKRNLAVLACWVAALAQCACSGSVEGSDTPGVAGQATGPFGPGGGGAASGGTANFQPPTNPDAITLLQSPPAEPVTANITCTPQEVVPEGRIWRLSASAYANSVKDNLGIATIDADTAPLDSVTATTRFSASSQQNVVNQPWTEWYFAQGERTATQLVAALPAAHACMLQLAASAECVQGFIADYAGKLFRRPLSAEEVTRYQTAYTQYASEMDPTEATTALLQAWTMSPNHLFRTELGNKATGEVELTQYELASEISFTFGDTSPDAALLADAQAGRLTDPAVVRAHAERLLSGPGGRQVLKDFFFDYLHVRELEGGALDPAQRPLVPSMQAEVENFVQNVVFTQGGGLDALFGSSNSYVDGPLAAFYGVTAGSGTAAVDTERPGLLHQAAFLNARRDATRRGLFVRGELLCSPPAPPPPDAAAAAMQLVFDENDTAREILDVINNAGAVCAACHASFSPLGLSFEHYDKLGEYREQQNGKTLDVTGTFPALGDLSGSFNDSIDMVQQVMSSNQGQLCFSKRFISYLQGRNAHGVLDGCLITRARDQMVNNQLSLTSFMLELTQDPSFYRRINLGN